MNKSRSRKYLCFFTVFVTLFFLGSSAFAVMLSDGELYFDPGSIQPDYYPRIYLPDLAEDNNYVWAAGFDPVTDADILPILKPGVYPPGYPYSQADYLDIPNVDYFADLTGGTLTVIINKAGLYHVRVTQSSGIQTIYAIFAEADFKEKEKADTSGGTKKLEPAPDADVFVVENSDKTMDNSAKVWEKNGREVKRVNSRKEAVDAIKAKAKALGRKIHAEIDGHGTSGNISTGAGKDNIPEKQIDLDSVADFQKEIDDDVNEITFQGCSVGKGEDGKKFLKILADSIGKASAWDKPVLVIDQNYFAVSNDTNWVTEETKSKAAHNVNPTISSAPVNSVITWEPGDEATGHMIYFGTSFDDVNSRNPSVFHGYPVDPCWAPPALSLGETYYYAIDETAGPDTWPGDVWEFTVQGSIDVGDFEYETTGQLQEEWNPAGGAHDYTWGDYRHYDERCMKMSFMNNTTPFYSEVQRTFSTPQNWGLGGSDELSLWVKSPAALSPSTQLYVKVIDFPGMTATVFINNPATLEEINSEDGYTWNIGFDQLSGIDLQQVHQIVIGIGVPYVPTGEGILLIDDVKLGPPEQQDFTADLYPDGIVNFRDFAVFAEQWLQ
jgi:hypothetical protein